MVSWTRRALKRVVRSTMAGETMALGGSLGEVENVQYTVQQLLGRMLPAIARTDSKSLFDRVHCGRQVNEKWLLVELQALRKARKEKRKELEWCTSEQQLADALTKSMAAWRLINVMITANINAMHVTSDKYVSSVRVARLNHAHLPPFIPIPISTVPSMLQVHRSFMRVILGE